MRYPCLRLSIKWLNRAMLKNSNRIFVGQGLAPAEGVLYCLLFEKVA